jgi:hypothetical protein
MKNILNATVNSGLTLLHLFSALWLMHRSNELREGYTRINRSQAHF